MAVSKGRLYTMGNENDTDTVWCLDASTGKEVWRHNYPCPKDPKEDEGGPRATPTVDGDKVYTFSRTGLAFCLDADSGQVIWKRDLRDELEAAAPKWGFASSPVVRGKLLILNAGPAAAALDKATGKTVWSSGRGEAGYASAVPFDYHGSEYVAIPNAKQLSVIKVSDGTALCQFPWPTDNGVNAADAIVFDGKAFISSDYNRGCALIKVGPEPQVLWQNRKMRNHFNSCVLQDGYIYGFDMSTLRCMDFKTGEEKWSLDGFGKGSLIIADGKLIILSERGELAVADASPAEFRQISRAKVIGGKCWTVPVLSGGRIYCRNAAGDLVCVDVRKR
jgi:outer membrane protein assembly factor BamB